MGYINAYLKTTAGILAKQMTVAASATVEFPLPRTWDLIGDIYVTVQGLSVTDAVTYAELAEAITDFRIRTVKGDEVWINTGIDLVKWPGWCHWGWNHIASVRIGAADNQSCAITYAYPLGLGLKKWYCSQTGEYFGLPGYMADALVISFAADSCFDNHLVTVEVDGLVGEGVVPSAYQTIYVYGYTSTAVGQVNDINLPTDAVLRGVYGFTTTNFDVDTTQTDLGTEIVQLIKNERAVLETHTLTRQHGVQRPQIDDAIGYATGAAGHLVLESDQHWFWDLDYGEGGHGYHIDQDTKIRVTAGVVEAVRIYRVLYSLVPAPNT